MNKKIRNSIIIFCVTLFGLSFAIFRVEEVDQYKTTTLDSHALEKTIDFTALWYPVGYAKVNLGSYSDVQSVMVKEGDMVVAGQAIVQLQNQSEYNQFKAAQSSYYAAIEAKKAANAASNTSITITPIPGVLDTPITIPVALPSLTSSSQLQGVINSTYYQMLSAETNLAKRVLKAPVAGMVVAVVFEDYSTSGSTGGIPSSLAGLSGLTSTTASAGNSGNYIIIASTTDTRITASFSDQEIVAMKIGMPVRLTSTLSDVPLTGKVSHISRVPTIQSTSLTEEPSYKVTMTLDVYPDYPYGSKLEGNISIAKKEQASVLPFDSVTLDSASKGSVLVYHKNTATTERKSVSLGLIADDAVEITGGITSDDAVVIDRAPSKKIITIRPWIKNLFRKN